MSKGVRSGSADLKRIVEIPIANYCDLDADASF